MLFFFLLFVLGVRDSCGQDSAANWTRSSLPEGDILYTCSGTTATFHWSYDISLRDALCDVQWFFQGKGGSRQLVAMMSHGKFLPTQDFQQRAAVLDKAGLILSNVSVADSGNFSVEVHIFRPSGDRHTLLQSHAHLVVSDKFMTEDGDLHTKRSPDAVMDPRTDQWSAELKCGNFIFHDDPLFPVEWETPTGEIRNSTDFREGYFHLLLGNPVSGGNYTCRVPPAHAKRACLPDDATRQSSYHIDRVDVRLFLAEQENLHLKRDLRLLQQKFTSVEERMAKLEAAAATRHATVAFHATGLQSSAPSAGNPLIFNYVHYNHGNAYSSRTGHFVAPYDALYYFIASTGAGSWGSNSGANHYLLVNSTQIAASYSYSSYTSYVMQYQMSSVHGVVRLQKGQYVWVKADGSTYRDSVSSFTGFQLSHEL